MAEQLKKFFNEALVRSIAGDLHRAYPPFREADFITRGVTGLEDLELVARGWHIAEALYEHLPQSFSAAADVLIASLGPELDNVDGLGLALFRYLPHVLFIQKYGLEDFEPAMRAQYELTKRFSAESSIRAFLVRHPAETYARLQEWARDGNVHVRRLVSEGTRPRLPWAPRLRSFQDDPRPVIDLLEMLKDDPERYVQCSVANSLNDIGKDHPDLAVDVCRRWLEEPSASRTWIVRHALRSLVKRTHRGALELLGVGGQPSVMLSGLRVGSRVRLGGALHFSFAITSTGPQSQDLLVDYVVHFLKANGTTKPKVFKLRKITLPPGATFELAGKVSFKDLTTRRHYPGRHCIEALINGVSHPLADFDVHH